MPSTFNVFAISGTVCRVSLKRITEVREMTRRPLIIDRRPISSSVMPSARNSCAGSPERFFRGKTAIDFIAEGFSPFALPPRVHTDIMPIRAMPAIAPRTSQARIDTFFGSGVAAGGVEATSSGTAAA